MKNFRFASKLLASNQCNYRIMAKEIEFEGKLLFSISANNVSRREKTVYEIDEFIKGL